MHIYEHSYVLTLFEHANASIRIRTGNCVHSYEHSLIHSLLFSSPLWFCSQISKQWSHNPIKCALRFVLYCSIDEHTSYTILVWKSFTNTHALFKTNTNTNRREFSFFWTLNQFNLYYFLLNKYLATRIFCLQIK